MRIAVDKNQLTGSHEKSNKLKHDCMEELGVELVPVPIPFGDYCLVTDEMQETIDRRGSKLKKQDLVADIKFSLDTKKGLSEVVSNICSSSHNRFRDEVIMAHKMGARFVVLIEEPGIHSVQDVFSWTNPRYYNWCKIKKLHEQGKALSRKISSKPPTRGEQLAKAMLTMSSKYGVEWMFTTREDAGRNIIELLSGYENGK